ACLRIVLGLVLKQVRERVLQALVVRVDDEERLEAADRVVDSGQAHTGREVGLARGRLVFLGWPDAGGGRPRGSARSLGTARPRGPPGADGGGVVRPRAWPCGRV